MLLTFKNGDGSRGRRAPWPVYPPGRCHGGAEQEQGGEGEPAAWAIGAGTWRRAGAEACQTSATWERALASAASTRDGGQREVEQEHVCGHGRARVEETGDQR